MTVFLKHDKYHVSIVFPLCEQTLCNMHVLPIFPVEIFEIFLFQNLEGFFMIFWHLNIFSITKY